MGRGRHFFSIRQEILIRGACFYRVTYELTRFAPLPNPIFPFGPPAVDPVPDSIHLFRGQFLVTLLSGFPFPPDVAQVRTVDPHTGGDEPFITGLTSAIDVLPVKTRGGRDEFLTLEFSADQLAQAPGKLQLFTSPAGPPQKTSQNGGIENVYLIREDRS